MCVCVCVCVCVCSVQTHQGVYNPPNNRHKHGHTGLRVLFSTTPHTKYKQNSIPENAEHASLKIRSCENFAARQEKHGKKNCWEIYKKKPENTEHTNQRSCPTCMCVHTDRHTDTQTHMHQEAKTPTKNQKEKGKQKERVLKISAPHDKTHQKDS